MIKLDEALAAVTALGLDTPPFIYFIEQHPSYLTVVREIFRRVDSMAIAGYSSMITLTEVLTQPKRLQNSTVENEYLSLLLYSSPLIIQLPNVLPTCAPVIACGHPTPCN